jgi:hypothetical protein
MQLNNGLLTSMKGASILALLVSALDASNGDDCTLEETFGSDQVDSVEHDAAGVYIVKFAAPYPVNVVCIPHIDAAATTSDILTARVDSSSYDSETGWLTINVSNDDDAGAPVAADGASTDMLHLLMVLSRYTTI